MALQAIAKRGIQAPDRSLIEATIAIVRKPPETALKGLTTRGHLGKPDYEALLREWHAYVEQIGKMGVKVHALPADEKNPDSHYTRDNAVMYRNPKTGEEIAIMLSPGAQSRRAEIPPMREFIGGLGITVTGINKPGALVEGGDVLIYQHANLVIIGESWNAGNIRTNSAGIAELTGILKEVNPEIRVVSLPHKGVLHLETGFNMVTPSLALHDPACVVNLGRLMSFIDVVVLPAAEGYAANAIPLNGRIMIVNGPRYPTARASVEPFYGEEGIHPIDTTENEKLDGSLTCWSILGNLRDHVSTNGGGKAAATNGLLRA